MIVQEDSVVSLLALLIHVGLGVILGAVFAAAGFAKLRSDGLQKDCSVWVRFTTYAQNILIVCIALAVLVVVMKFARDYQPRSWVYLVALLVTWIATGAGCWRFVFRKQAKTTMLGESKATESGAKVPGSN